MVTREDILNAAKAKGKRGRKAKFTEQDVAFIRQRFVNEPGATVKTLSEEYNVSYATMLKVIYGKDSYSF